MHSSVANDASSAGASPGCSTTRRRRNWFMTHHFYVVTVKVEHERPVIVGVIVRPRTRRAVVAAAGLQRRAVESVHQSALGDAKRHVHRRVVRFALRQPEIRLRRHAEAGDVAATGDTCGKLGEQLVADRLQGCTVEGLRALKIAHAQPGMVDHRAASRGAAAPAAPLTKAAVAAMAISLTRKLPGRWGASNRALVPKS